MHCFDQAAGVGMLGGRTDRPRGAFLYDPAPMQHRHPVAKGCHHRKVVGDEQAGCAAGMTKVMDQGKDTRLYRDVQRRGHLVAQDHVRLGCKGTCQRDPLAFAA